MSNDLMDLVPAGLAEMMGDRLQVSPAGWLCIALAKAYGADTAEEERTRSTATVSKMLDGARDRGFANAGTLLTLAASGSEARCFAGLAREAMEGATPEEVTAVTAPLRQGGEQ
jgi:hypothetical protein